MSLQMRVCHRRGRCTWSRRLKRFVNRVKISDRTGRVTEAGAAAALRCSWTARVDFRDVDTIKRPRIVVPISIEAERRMELRKRRQLAQSKA